jgi:dienelactone hydrolase
VIYVHGAEGTGAGGLAWTAFPGRWATLNAVARHCTVLSSDLGGNATWGNDAVISAISAAWTYLKTLPGVSQDKVSLLCQSMGGTAAIAWAAANPTQVDRVAMMIPVINLLDVRNSSAYQSAIDAAYGGAYSEATYGAAHNPLTIAAAGKLSGIPIQLWYGATDTLCKPEYALQFAAAAGSCQLRKMNGGHAEETVYNMDSEAIAAFLAGA